MSGLDSNAGRPAPVGWYGALLGGAVPILVGGFLASAVADRIVFVGWALGSAVAYALALRWSWQAAWPRWARAGAPLAALALALGAFGLLAVRYGEDLALGFAALRPLGGGP